MADNHNQKLDLEELFHYDFTVNLDAEVYKNVISDYQCMLLNLIPIYRQCIEELHYSPKILFFDYDGRIICNRNFNIQIDISNVQIDSNFTLELIQDIEDSNLIYFLLQEKEHPEEIVFHYLNYNMPLHTINKRDFKMLVKAIIKLQQLDKKHTDFNFEIITHILDFKTGDWLIKRPSLN